MRTEKSYNNHSIDDELFRLLDEHFRFLDEAEFFKSDLFPNDMDKEKYETLITFALRKYQAALYHYDNVIRLQIADSEERNKFFDRTDGKFGLISIREPKNAYAHELSAFLGALKSALDFIATVCALYSPGTQFDSISALMKMVKKRSSYGPILAVIAQNLQWLQSLRAYRHHLVHRRTLCITGGCEKHSINGFSNECPFPVMIPEVILSNVSDTRKSRMMAETETFDRIETKVIEGQAIVGYSIEHVPPKGYIEISVFMINHLREFEKFFKEILTGLSQLNFQTGQL